MKVLSKTICFFLFFILTIAKFSVCIGICRENEQQALESLKKEVYDPSDSLSSWIVGKDCCEWEGVVCDNLSRHVIELYMGSDFYEYRSSRVWYSESHDLRINNFEWLPSLSNLENLNISSVDRSKATNWLQVFLHYFILSVCMIRGSPGKVCVHTTLPKPHYMGVDWVVVVAVDLSHNQFVGEVPFISTPNVLMLGSNNFSGPLPHILQFHDVLDLSNNSFSGGLSHLCETKKNGSYKLEFLNLEGNDLSGEIPDCWMNWPELRVLNLGDNNLIGGIPKSMEVLSNLQSLDFRRNRLTVPLPSSLANCTELLKIDLAENEFVGHLPPWLGMKFSGLKILSLSSNRFYGELPPEICHLKDLQILDLANNSFFGTIPRCINNLTAMVTGNKLGEADIKYATFSDGKIARESAMVTSKGNIYQYDKTLALVTSMDMSNNNLSGEIPISFTGLVGLRICNFSENHLTGRIPNSIGNMKVLESLDLSENKLSGQIPQSLSSLSTLSFLNLSYNNLSGKIPVSTQLQSFNSSSFQGNELCGLPLLANCSSGGQIPDVDTKKDERDEDELEWFYISMAIGFGLSFWGVCSCLLFKRSWRHAYYRFLDRCWKYLCEKLQIHGWI